MKIYPFNLLTSIIGSLGLIHTEYRHGGDEPNMAYADGSAHGSTWPGGAGTTGADATWRKPFRCCWRDFYGI